MIHRLITNETFRKKLEAKMTTADAATFESTIANIKSEMTTIKPIHEQIRSARLAHDTVAARAAFGEGIKHFTNLMTDRKIIRDLLLRYKPSHNEPSASNEGNLTVSPLYPNPFHAGAGNTASLNYAIKNDGHVRIALIDGHGNLIRTLTDEDLQSGEHSVSVPTTGLQPGAYMIQVQTGNENKMTKMIVVK